VAPATGVGLPSTIRYFSFEVAAPTSVVALFLFASGGGSSTTLDFDEH
jgi:hypothetical protein